MLSQSSPDKYEESLETPDYDEKEFSEEDLRDSEEARAERAKAYKIIVNKPLLYEFLLCEEEEMGTKHLDEVHKVIDIVMAKHFSSHYKDAPSLKSQAFATILERRFRFDPDKDAYNYIYTQSRNEIGNLIYRLSKEYSIEDNLSYKESSSALDESLESSTLSPAIIKYAHYLTGEVDYTVKRISKRDACDVLIFLKLNDYKTKQVDAPDFMKHSKNALGILYKLLKDVFNSDI